MYISEIYTNLLLRRLFEAQRTSSSEFFPDGSPPVCLPDTLNTQLLSRGFSVFVPTSDQNL